MTEDGVVGGGGVVDGERNELQDGIAVGLSDEKPWKEREREREREREKREVWRRIRAKSEREQPVRDYSMSLGLLELFR